MSKKISGKYVEFYYGAIKVANGFDYEGEWTNETATSRGWGKMAPDRDIIGIDWKGTVKGYNTTITNAQLLTLVASSAWADNPDLRIKVYDKPGGYLKFDAIGICTSGSFLMPEDRHQEESCTFEASGQVYKVGDFVPPTE
jgi:hypothetical protein